MKFKKFTGGMNTLDPAEDIGDNELESLVNACYDEGSLLRSRFGFSQVRSATNVYKIYPFYVGGSLHLIYTASGGLYDNGSVIDASFTGAFIADEYNNMLYLCNGTYLKRYDGTTVYNVGMDAPDAPTVAASDNSTKVLEDFETVGTPAGAAWAIAASPYDGGGTGTATHDAVTFIEGAESLKVTVPEGTKMKVTRVFTAAQDWTAFADGAGSEDDYITFKVLVENADDLRYFQFLVDVDDGNFDTNYYYTGQVTQGTRYETVIKKKYGTTSGKGAVGTSIYHYSREQVAVPYTEIDYTVEVLPRSSGSWVTFQLPKSDFSKEGTDSTKNWSTVKAIGFIIWANDDLETDPLTLYIDDGQMRGYAGVDGGFYGTYYFVAIYYNETRGEWYAASEESDPVECDVNGVEATGIPATFPDAQATHYVLFARKAEESNWFQVASVAEGTTSVETSYDGIAIFNNPELTEQSGIFPLPKVLSTGEVKTRDNSNNTPPPTAVDYLTFHRGKLIMAVDNLLYHSKPGQPWACPTDNWIEASSTSDPIQGMYSDGANLIVHSKSKDFNYINAGDYDGSGLYMGYLARARRSAGCVGRHSIHSGLFASPFGISTFDGQDGQTLSEKVKPTYRALSGKSNLHGAVYEDMYLLLTRSGNSIVMERMGDGFRFHEWGFTGAPYCCAIDAQTNTLYVGTSTGIYQYNRGTYKDSAGAFEFSARTKIFEYGGEVKDAPLESAFIRCNTGGNDLTWEVLVDGESIGNSGTINNTEKTDEPLFLSVGTLGCFLQIVLTASITENAPVRIYQIKIT